MKCIGLLPCEKIIVDKDGAHSIINVMVNVNAQLRVQQFQPDQPPKNLEIPPNAVTALTWWIYTLWSPSSEDIGKSFDQVYQVYWPNGEKFIERNLPFTQKDGTIQQTNYFITGFPVGQEGKMRIVTWLDSKGHRSSDINETFINIKHLALEVSSEIPAPMPIR